MLKFKPGGADSADSWVGRKDNGPDTEPRAAVPHDKTADAVLWDMGVVLATTLSIALAVNLVLSALHIG